MSQTCDMFEMDGIQPSFSLHFSLWHNETGCRRNFTFVFWKLIIIRSNQITSRCPVLSSQISDIEISGTMRPISISIYHKICQAMSEIFMKLISSGVTDGDFLERMSMLQKPWCLPRVRRVMSGRRTDRWAWGGPSCSRSAAPSRTEGTSSRRTGCGTIWPGSWCVLWPPPSSWAASSWRTSGEQLGSWGSWAGAAAPVCWGWA